MKLKETIKKVLREEDEKKDLSKIIKRIVDTFLEDNDPEKEYITNYELRVHRFQGQPRYSLMINFSSGPNSKLWPKTQAVHTVEEAILNEIRDYVQGYVGVKVNMWSQS